jgi:hypothetical protein
VWLALLLWLGFQGPAEWRPVFFAARGVRGGGPPRFFARDLRVRCSFQFSARGQRGGGRLVLAARARRGRCWRGVRRLIRSRLFYLIHFDCYLAFPVCQTIKKQSPVGTKNKPVRGKTKSEKTRRRLLRRKIVQLKKKERTSFDGMYRSEHPLLPLQKSFWRRSWLCCKAGCRHEFIKQQCRRSEHSSQLVSVSYKSWLHYGFNMRIQGTHNLSK